MNVKGKLQVPNAVRFGNQSLGTAKSSDCDELVLYR